MGDGAVLETRDLHKHFGGVRAVAGIDFTLAEGELRCLIGPNGAGKSTFFKLVTGQLGPTSGRILFAGADIAGLAAHRIGRLGIGIKNQVPSVYNGLTVAENLWIAARARAGRRAADRVAEELLERLELTAAAGQRVATLAHGQRQWVEIGMVMARRPKLVLLDEPTAGMALEEVERTARLIRDFNREASIIVVEHDMQFIRRLAAVVTVFHQGRILIEDSMDKIEASEQVRAVYLGSFADA